MTPDLTPPEGWSKPIRGPVKRIGSPQPFSQDIAIYYEEVESWKIGANGQSPNGIYSLRIGSEIALLNAPPDSGQKGRETGTPRTDTLFAPIWLKKGPVSDEDFHLVTKSYRRMEAELAAKDALIRLLYVLCDRARIICLEDSDEHTMDDWITDYEAHLMTLRRAEQGKEGE